MKKKKSGIIPIIIGLIIIFSSGYYITSFTYNLLLQPTQFAGWGESSRILLVHFISSIGFFIGILLLANGLAITILPRSFSICFFFIGIFSVITLMTPVFYKPIPVFYKPTSIEPYWLWNIINIFFVTNSFGIFLITLHIIFVILILISVTAIILISIAIIFQPKIIVKQHTTIKTMGSFLMITPIFWFLCIASFTVITQNTVFIIGYAILIPLIDGILARGVSKTFKRKLIPTMDESQIPIITTGFGGAVVGGFISIFVPIIIILLQKYFDIYFQLFPFLFILMLIMSIIFSIGGFITIISVFCALLNPKLGSRLMLIGCLVGGFNMYTYFSLLKIRKIKKYNQ